MAQVCPFCNSLDPDKGGLLRLLLCDAAVVSATASAELYMRQLCGRERAQYFKRPRVASKAKAPCNACKYRHQILVQRMVRLSLTVHTAAGGVRSLPTVLRTVLRNVVQQRHLCCPRMHRVRQHHVPVSAPAPTSAASTNTSALAH